MNKNKEEVFPNQIVIRRTDMPEEQQELVERIVQDQLRQSKREQDTVRDIQTDLEKNFQTVGWNVVLGKEFGSFVFHRSKNFIQF